jgi:hypothetical protein
MNQSLQALSRKNSRLEKTFHSKNLSLQKIKQKYLTGIDQVKMLSLEWKRNVNQFVIVN